MQEVTLYFLQSLQLVVVVVVLIATQAHCLLAVLAVGLFKMVVILREVEQLVKETLAAHIQVMKQAVAVALLLLEVMLQAG
jgi:hypothetical protein